MRRQRLIIVFVMLHMVISLIGCAGTKIENFTNPTGRDRRVICFVSRLSNEQMDQLRNCFSRSYLHLISIESISEFGSRENSYKRMLVASILGNEIYEEIEELILRNRPDDIIFIEGDCELGYEWYRATVFNTANEDSFLVKYKPGIIKRIFNDYSVCNVVESMLKTKLYSFPFYDPSAFEKKVLENHPSPALKVDKANRYSDTLFESDKNILLKHIDAELHLLPMFQSSENIALLQSNLQESFDRLWSVFEKSARYSNSKDALGKYEEFQRLYELKESISQYSFRIVPKLESKAKEKILQLQNKVAEANELRESKTKNCVELFSFKSDLSGEATKPFLPLLDILKKDIIEIVSSYEAYYLCPMTFSISSSATNSIILRLNCSYSLKEDIENRKPIHKMSDGTFFFDIRLLAALFRGAVGPYHLGLFKYFWGNPYGKEMLNADWIFAIRLSKNNGDYFEIWGYADSNGFIQCYSDALIKVGKEGPYFVHDRDGISPWDMEFFAGPSLKFDVPPPFTLRGELSTASVIYDFFGVEYE